MTDHRHCFSYVDTDIPPDLTIDAYRRARVSRRERRGLRARLRSLLG